MFQMFLGWPTTPLPFTCPFLGRRTHDYANCTSPIPDWFWHDSGADDRELNMAWMRRMNWKIQQDVPIMQHAHKKRVYGRLTRHQNALKTLKQVQLSTPKLHFPPSLCKLHQGKVSIKQHITSLQRTVYIKATRSSTLVVANIYSLQGTNGAQTFCHSILLCVKFFRLLGGFNRQRGIHRTPLGCNLVSDLGVYWYSELG